MLHLTHAPRWRSLSRKDKNTKRGWSFSQSTPLLAAASCRRVGNKQLRNNVSQNQPEKHTVWKHQTAARFSFFFCVQTEVIFGLSGRAVDEFILLCNTAQPPWLLSNTTWECQHLNAKLWAPADMISGWRATSGDWRNQKLSGDLSTAGPSETS